MGALMDECAHGADGSYDDPEIPGCPYCEIDRLRVAIRSAIVDLEEEGLWGGCHSNLMDALRASETQTVGREQK